MLYLSLPFMCSTPNPNVMMLGGRAFGRCVDHDGNAEITVLMIETPKELPSTS